MIHMTLIDTLRKSLTEIARITIAETEAEQDNIEDIEEDDDEYDDDLGVEGDVDVEEDDVSDDYEQSLSGNNKSLVLDADLYAGIFMSEITKF